jgi:hypothetical protein
MSKKLIYNPENPQGTLVDFTDAELSQKVTDDEKTAIRKTEFNANKYQRDREAEYISKLGNWQDQLDMIYHDIDNWKSEVKKIKDANPKE